MLKFIQNYLNIFADLLESVIPKENNPVRGGINAFLQSLRTATTKQGRISRKDFLWASAGYAIIYLVYSVLINFLSSAMSIVPFISPVLGVIDFLVMIIAIVFCFTLDIKRLHDRGKSGWYFFMWFIPFVGFILIVIQLLSKGEDTTNKFGETTHWAGIEDTHKDNNEDENTTTYVE